MMEELNQETIEEEVPTEDTTVEHPVEEISEPELPRIPDILVHRFDDNGFYMEDLFVPGDQPIPSDCTTLPLPQPIYKPQFVNGQWIDAITEEELEAIKNPKPNLTLEERVKQLEAVVNSMLLGGI
ncbi:hypothetical protein H9636_07035 [Ureibacillus sp. Re31]|uniref:Bacteriophage SP-beta YorD domain-containing protein n=1 Tax=Ureibacillus galli TaxID=2762222 RepID=A0ABR8XB95_9BACL|nr:hypothetical protein [Ureibacillus galli]MBD8026411.1 hypothetical protein [Ureibacillus galli]